MIKLFKLAVLSAFAVLGFCQPASYDEALSQKAVYYSLASFCEKTDIDNWKCGRACSAI